MPILQRFVSKYPPCYYLGPERLNGGFPKTPQDFTKFIQPYAPPYGGRRIESIISIYDSWRCWHELYYLLRWNGFGKHFAFSQGKYGVCSCFRGECEFNLQVDDRFAIEIHAFELSSPWTGPPTSPPIKRYIGAFFFASDKNVVSISDSGQKKEDPEIKHFHTLSSLHTKYEELDGIYMKGTPWPEEGFEYPQRCLREAIVRRPKHVIHATYHLVRFFPLSLNYGLEYFDGVPYAFPDKDGMCIHSAIYLATLLTSQWSIPIPPLESTFHLSMLTQDRLNKLNENFNKILGFLNELDEITYIKDLHETYDKSFTTFQSTDNYEKQQKKRKGFRIQLEELHERIGKQTKLLLKNAPAAGRQRLQTITKEIDNAFDEINTIHTDISRYCVSIEMTPKNSIRGCNFGEMNQYYMNVLGFSLSAAVDLMNRDGATCASAIEEIFEPGKLRDCMPERYIVQYARNLFAHILRCYLNERIPVIVPVRHSKLPGREPNPENGDTDHVVLVIGYHPGFKQKIDDMRIVFVDNDETGLYKECSFDEFFAASVPYDEKKHINTMTKKENDFPSIHMLVSMPKECILSFKDIAYHSLLKQMGSITNVLDDPTGAGRATTFYLQHDKFPVLCHARKLISYLSHRIRLTDIEIRFLQEYSWRNYVWLEAPDGYDLDRTYEPGSTDFPIRIFDPYTEASQIQFWPTQIIQVAGESFRIQISGTQENLNEMNDFIYKRLNEDARIGER